MAEDGTDPYYARSIALGEEALAKLDMLTRCLEDANYGVTSFFLESTLTTYLKRRHIKRAEELAREAKAALESFRRSLDDRNRISLDTTEFYESTKYFDYLFGVIGSLEVQKSVKENLAAANRARDSVRRKIQILENTI